jgi:hypothetical protein
MAKAGLVRFSRLDWEVGQSVLPVQRTRLSKHAFTHPQLLAVLCLMRKPQPEIDIREALRIRK